jgi:hypothetical protein
VTEICDAQHRRDVPDGTGRRRHGGYAQRSRKRSMRARWLRR